MRRRQRKKLLGMGILCLISIKIYYDIYGDTLNKEEKQLLNVIERRLNILRFGCARIRNDKNAKTIFSKLIPEVIAADEYRFCKVPKCGCTFWLEVFLVVTGKIKPNDLSNLDREDLHFKLQNDIVLYDYLPQDSDIFIMVTRNPWNRLYSAYIDKIYRGQRNFINFYSKMTTRLNSQSGCHEVPTFQEFLDHISRRKANGFSLEDHWKPVSEHCKVCSGIQYSYIIKHESFAEESSVILKTIKQLSSESSESLKSVLTNDFAEQSFTQLLRQFVSELSKDCFTFIEKMRRLWLSFQIQGLLHDKIEFVEIFFEGYSEENKEEIINIFMTRRTLFNLSEDERNSQRKRHIENAYKAISQHTLRKIQTVYDNDFVLFEYDKAPPT